jgi:hypothetical protein
MKEESVDLAKRLERGCVVLDQPRSCFFSVPLWLFLPDFTKA